MGHVNRHLSGFKLAQNLESLPQRGDKLLFEGREIGFITSALASRRLRSPIALGYVRREQGQVGIELTLRAAGQESPARVAELPFRPD